MGIKDLKGKSVNAGKRTLSLGLALLGLNSWIGLPFELRASDLPASATTVSTPAPALTPAGVQARVSENYGKLPLSFEVNQGQTDPQVRFIARGSGYTLFLTATEAVLSLSQPAAYERAASGNRHGTKGAVLRLKLVGANPAPRVEGLEELPGKSNYFIGNDPTKWRTNIPTYAKVQHRDVYPGVTLVYRGDQGKLEYDFVVAPGADPKLIRFAVTGAGKLHLDSRGDLILEAATGEIRLHQPIVYQESAGSRRQIASGYVLSSARHAAFTVAAYDSSKPLVIDPVLVYRTYLGGDRSDQGTSIGVDSSGNAYVTGQTNSSNFPSTIGASQTVCSGCFSNDAAALDAFVAKLNASGSALVYATYLGGDKLDTGYGIAVDSVGDAYVTGMTYSANFPTTPGVFRMTSAPYGDWYAFVTKLNPSGSVLLYSTYLGSVVQNTAIAIDTSGNAYITGNSRGDFPTTPGSFRTRFSGYAYADAFVAKLNPSGSALVYSTFIGPAISSYIPGFGIAVDAVGNAYITGETTSANFPTSAGAFQSSCSSCGFPLSDAFVTKLNASGSALVYSTYLGGSGTDRGLAIAVDASGCAYITGSTNSRNFPTVNPVQAVKPGTVDQESALVSKLNATGSALVYSTYLGGESGGGAGFDIVVDESGRAYVTGSGAFVTALNTSGSVLLYSTRVGFEFGFGISVDSVGNIYVTGAAGNKGPGTTGAIQTVYGGGSWDAFVAKIEVWPKINSGGLVNAASYSTNAVSPGSIVSLFGTALSTLSATAGTLPLPNAMAGSVVYANGIAAPLYFISPNQINFQLPWEVMGRTQSSITVTVTGITSLAQTITLGPFAPGIFSLSQQGTGQGAIQISNSGGVFAAPAGRIPGVSSRPVKRGEFVSIYCTGLGDVTNRPASGSPASDNPLSTTLTAPTVTIGGAQAKVTFSGLAPGYVGLYQVNAQVPDNAPIGDAVPVIVTTGVTSNTVTIAVQ